jgi:hypothetical protein
MVGYVCLVGSTMGYSDTSYDCSGIGQLLCKEGSSSTDAPQEVASYLDER